MDQAPVVDEVAKLEIRQAALRLAQQFARAALAQILLGQREAVAAFLHHLEPAPAVVGGIAGNEDAVRLVRAPADPPPQLVQLGQAEAVGVLDKQDRRVGDVDADLDHARREQCLQFPRKKTGHGLLLFGRFEPAVQQADGVRCELFPHGFEFLIDGFEAAAALVIDARINDVRLPPRCQLVADEAPHLGQALRRADMRAHLAAARWHLIDHRAVEIAVNGQAKRAWDRRGGHHEHVRIAPLADEFLSLLDAEFVLLVNDRQPDVLERERLLDECVGADDEWRKPAVSHVQLRLVEGGHCFFCAGVEVQRDTKRLEPSAKDAVMLLGQNLGRREHDHAETALERAQRGTGGHGGLAAADVALQQPAHRVRAGHVGGDVVPSPLLRTGEGEAKRIQKRLHQPVVPSTRQRLDLGLKCRAPLADLSLKPDEFLECQPLAGQLGSSEVVGEMHRPNRLGQRQPMAVVAGQQPGVRVRHQVGELLHRLPQHGPEPPLLDAVGQPVHRDDALEVDELLALLGHLGLGVIHRARFLRLEFAVDVDEVAGFVVPLHVRHVPPAAMHPRRPVVEDEFEQTFAAPHPLDPGRHDRPGDRAGVAPGQGLGLVRLVAILVPPRAVPQQVGDRADAQLGQARGASAADAGQRRHRLAKGICRRLGHSGSCTGKRALGQAGRRFALSLGQANSYNHRPMADEQPPTRDLLWSQYTQVFAEMDDLSLARWMAQTLSQFSGQSWRLSHPLMLSYELAAGVAHDRQVWLKGMAIIPAGYTVAECCRAPLLPMFSRDVLDTGLLCKHCNEICIAFDDLPEELKPRIEKWATEYDTAHAIAHWEEDGIKLPPDYEQVLELAAQTAESLLAEGGTLLAPALLEFYPAVAWEDRDECLEVNPEDIDT